MEVEPNPASKDAVPPKAAAPFTIEKRLSPSKGPISCLRFSPDGKYLAVATAGKTVFVYQTSDYTCIHKFEGHEKGVNAIAWSPLSQYLASCSDDKTIRVWSLEKGILVRIITNLSQYPTCIAMNSRGTIIACSCDDYCIYFFSVFSRTLLRTIYAHSNTITSLEFNTDGSQLVSSSTDGYCRVWDCGSGNCIYTRHTLADNTPIVSSSFSPNNRYVLLSYLKSGLAIWCLEHDTIEKLATGHHVVDRFLCNACFYGQNMVTGSEDGKVVVYAIESEKVEEILCDADVVLSVAAASDLHQIAVGTMGDANEVIIVKEIVWYVC